jgi:hypothetical protein
MAEARATDRAHADTPTASATAASDAPASPSGATAARGRVPDFFIIGHERSGTTALWRMLRRHPQIFMPDHKEPRFFAPETRVRERRVRRGEPGAFAPRTLEAYLALFADAAPGQIAGEASPQYIRSPTAAARIAELAPDARLIAILREPVSFLRSYHIQCVQSGLEPERDLLKALALEQPRREGKRIPRGSSSPAWLLYSEHLRYVEQLRRFRAHFPAERMLVLIYDDYRADNEETVREVLGFLEVDPDTATEPIRVRGEQLKAVRFMALHRVSRKLRFALHHPQRVGLIARVVASLAPRRAQMLWRRLVYKVPPPLDERTTLELRRRFKPEVQALSEYLGRDLLSLWGYDEI